MFEDQGTQPRSKLWTFLPIAVVVFAAVVALIMFIGQTDPQALEPLTDVLHAGNPDFDWYSKYVELENRGIKMAKSFAGKRMVIFTGVIRNGGERTLDAVEIKLLLINQDQPIGEVIKLPVRPGPYTPPIPPLHSRTFTVYLEEFPPDWMSSRAEMELSGFRFLQAPASP